jgi:hypothetical protein
MAAIEPQLRARRRPYRFRQILAEYCDDRTERECRRQYACNAWGLDAVGLASVSKRLTLFGKLGLQRWDLSNEV